LKKRSKKIVSVSVRLACAKARSKQEFFCFFFCKKRNTALLEGCVSKLSKTKYKPKYY
jgi:hypothetical protein